MGQKVTLWTRLRTGRWASFLSQMAVCWTLFRGPSISLFGTDVIPIREMTGLHLAILRGRSGHQKGERPSPRELMRPWSQNRVLEPGWCRHSQDPVRLSSSCVQRSSACPLTFMTPSAVFISDIYITHGPRVAHCASCMWDISIFTVPTDTTHYLILFKRYCITSINGHKSL